MAQHDFNIANQTFPATRIDLNNAWAAIVSNSSGATAPATTYAYQFWYDTNTDTLKIRNTDNDAWISLFVLNQTTDTITSVDGRDIAVDGSKLDGIEAGATADQTAAEIRALVEAATDSNVFTDADHTKLNGIETAATADQTASEILTAIKTVDGAASGLDADLLDGQQGSYYTGYTDTAVSNLVDSSPAALNTLNELAAALGDDANFSTTVTNSIATKLPLAGGTMTGNITFAAGQSFDGRDVSADGSKLDGIEAGATADQTDAEIRAAVEAATDSNVFTDADHTKLNGIAASANNYVHPNHTGEVTSTADGATVIADNVVDEANLKVSNAPTNGYALTAQSGAAGGLTWAAVSGGGGGADLYAANESSPTAQPTATGANAIAVGEAAVASGVDAFAVSNATASGIRSVGIVGATASGDYSVAIGAGASSIGAKSVGIVGDALYDYTTAIGAGSNGSSPAIAGISGSASGGAVSLGGSFAGGVDSFASVITNNTNTYGATSANSISMGYLAKASGNYAITMGYLATAAGNYATCIGRSGSTTAEGASSLGGRSGLATGIYSTTVGGRSNKAYADYAVAMGYWTLANKIGQNAFASGRFNDDGDAQTSKFVLRSDTTDATPEALTTNNSTASTNNQIILGNNSAFSFHGTIVARESAASGTDCAAWKVEGLIRREGSASTTVLVNSATTVLDNTPNWGMALSADTTNGGLAITVTGAATSVRWVGTIHTSEVTYA